MNPFLSIFTFIAYSVLFTDAFIQTRILYSSALHFLPELKLHHIVLFSNSTGNKVYAIDFTPINQTSFSTLSKLLFGYNVPAEIRMIHLDNSHFLDTDDSLLDQWIQKSKNSVYISTIKVDDWNNEMNLYTHNCQHFSKWVTSLSL